MTIEEVAYALIAVLEGEKLVSYQDVKLVWTIGFGHTGPDVKPGMTITHEQAIALFAQDIAKLTCLVRGKYNTIQCAAYISFGYNCGFNALVSILNGGNMLHFVHSGDKVVDNLVRRRALEYALIEGSK